MSKANYLIESLEEKRETAKQELIQDAIVAYCEKGIDAESLISLLEMDIEQIEKVSFSLGVESRKEMQREKALERAKARNEKLPKMNRGYSR